MAIFASFTPLVEPISLDEAFLDVTASTAAFGDGTTIGRTIKRRVLDEVGLVVSVGVATNKLCAKVASDLRKPDALVVVPPGEEAAFLAPLPIRRLWGVGPQAQAALADYGVVTIGQLAATPAGTLHRRFGRFGDDLSARARGIDRGRVQVTHGAKSVGHEHTFDTDSADVGRLEATLLDLAESVASRLRRHELAAGSVQLKLRYEGFETLTRQAPLPRQTREARVLYDATLALLRRTLVAGRGVRLIGLTAINLSDAQQLTLFDAPDRTDRLTKSIDAVRGRFGERAITRARLLARGTAPPIRLRRASRRAVQRGRRRGLTDRTSVRYHAPKPNACSSARAGTVMWEHTQWHSSRYPRPRPASAGTEPRIDRPK